MPRARIQIEEPVEEHVEEQMEARPSRKTRLTVMALFTVAMLFILGGWATAAYLYAQNAKLSSDPNIQAEKQTSMILAKVGTLIELPSGELPSVLTIKDTSQLPKQAFFSDAKNGDVLIAYTKSAMAILYRPSTNKLIRVAAMQSVDSSSDASNATIQAPVPSKTKTNAATSTANN